MKSDNKKIIQKPQLEENLKDLNQPLENQKNQKEEDQKEVKKENDPTRFGDWQVNGRTIDF